MKKQRYLTKGKLIHLLSLPMMLHLCTAFAKPVTDAEAIQRNIEQLNKQNLPPQVPENTINQTTPTPADTLSVQVDAFQFIGATLVPDSTLQAAVNNHIGKTLSYLELTDITHKISALYQSKGWLAKVYLPPQDIQNGLVTIEINEAKLGKIRTQTDEKARLNPKRANQMLSKAQQTGAPLNSQALERAMLLINDTPGFLGQATLSSGAQTGETDITLNLTDRPIFNGKVWVDNYGSRLLGKARLNGQASFNNLTGWGDQLNIQAVASRGLGLVQSNIELPIGNAGTRVNIGGSVSNYSVKGGGLSDLNAEGDAYSYRLGIKHPVIRSRFSNLAVYANAESLNFLNKVLGLEVSNKEYHAFTVGLKADKSDAFGLGGTFWGGLSVTSGNLDLSANKTDLAADSISARVDGHYNKLNFYLGRQQILGEKLTAKALFSGQMADTNLGGFEKFALGGPAGLSGFTVGEAAADQGWMLNLEGKYAIAQNFSASVLADAGGVCQNKNTWAGWNSSNPNQPNCYQLASLGAGLGYTTQKIDTRLSYGRKISGNRGLDRLGNDTEGENAKHQLWLQITANF